jgi:hypothetical protein
MVIANTSQKGLKDGWTRDTFILRKEYLEGVSLLGEEESERGN